MDFALNYSTLINFCKKFYSWVLPYHCILCGNPSTKEQDLCENCHRDLPVMLLTCPHCARMMIDHNRLCGACLTKKPPFDATYALYLYQKPVSNLILNLKFQHTLVNARILGELLTEKIRHWYSEKPLPEVIIPVPLHASRLRERGFNQALEIARPIAQNLGLPIDYSVCSRIKSTLPQATLHPKERKNNIKNAFQLTQSFSYRHIAVIDDVITTGHTISEFCKIFKKTDVQRIDVWCCARPSLSQPSVYTNRD